MFKLFCKKKRYKIYRHYSGTPIKYSSKTLANLRAKHFRANDKLARIYKYDGYWYVYTRKK